MTIPNVLTMFSYFAIKYIFLLEHVLFSGWLVSFKFLKRLASENAETEENIIIEQLSLEGTSGGNLVHPSAQSRGNYIKMHSQGYVHYSLEDF